MNEGRKGMYGGREKEEREERLIYLIVLFVKIYINYLGAKERII